MAISGRVLLGAAALGVYFLVALAIGVWIAFMAVMFDDFFFVPAPVTVVGAALVALALPAALLVLLVATLRGRAQAQGIAFGAHVAVAGLCLLAVGVIIARTGASRGLAFPLLLLAVSGMALFASPARTPG